MASLLQMMARILRQPVVRASLLLITIGFIVVALAKQWEDVAASWQALDIAWPWVATATALVIATYAVLIHSWRILLSGWGGHLAFGSATRIWAIANLGRWLPGKVWSIGALGYMASKEGVSGVAAAGSSVLGTLLNLGAGLAMAVVLGADGLEYVAPGFRVVSIAAAIGFVVGVAALPRLLPRVLATFASRRGLPLTSQHLSAGQLWMATGINLLSWVAYGVAFWMFSRAVTPRISGDPLMFIAVYSASYLAGFLALFAPGGLGVRELALGGLLVGLGMAGQGDAAVLSATSRIWLTVLEVLPGLLAVLTLSPGQRAALRRNS
jgi:uncharacterized membrane protein YbhN (UPF0104 family)